MLRVGQYSSISRRLLAIRSSPAFVQKDALVLSGQLPRTLASHDNNVCCCHTLASNSNSSVSNATRGLAIVSTYTMPGNPYGASSRRLMSTTPEGASGGKDVSGASQAGHGAAPSTSFVPDGAAGLNADAAAATDAITASAGAADQAQAVIEAAPATFKLALYTPPYLAMCALDSVHAATGMPYWMTIVGITLALRTAILPIGVLASRNAARTAAMKPEMDQLQAAVKADQQSSQHRRAERYRQETKALYKKYDCSLMMNAALPVVQLPLFIGFFMALRRMPDAVPDFATGGTLWFQDLGAADPYMIFPVTAGVTTLLLAELGADGMSLASGSTKMRAGMRAMSLLIVPFTMNISTGVFMYWTTSNVFSILQTLALKSPSLKRRFNFPNPPKKQPEITAEKELNWLDVFGGDKPLQAYKKMSEQREVQAWFGERVGSTGDRGVPSGGADGGPVVREGAPLPPPPSMTPAGGKARPVVAAGRAEPESQQPQVVTYAVRPKPAGGAKRNDSKKSSKRGKKQATS